MLKQRVTGGFSQRKTAQKKSSASSLDSMTVGFGSYTPSGWAKERATKKARWQAMAMEDDGAWEEEASRELAAATAEAQAQEQELEQEHGTRIMTLADLMHSHQGASNIKGRKRPKTKHISLDQVSKQQGTNQEDEFTRQDLTASTSETLPSATQEEGNKSKKQRFQRFQRQGSIQPSRWGTGATQHGIKQHGAATQEQERDSDVTHAINAMVGLLAQREYGAQELKSKCLRKFTPDAVEQALQHCQERGYQSEERYGQMLVRHMEFSLYGPLRLQVEGQKKKVSWDLLRELSAQIDWDQLAYQALIKKYGIEILDYDMQRKALAYLGRRGFSSSSCLSAMQRMQQEAKEQSYS